MDGKLYNFITILCAALFTLFKLEVWTFCLLRIN